MHIAINLRHFVQGEIGGLESYVRLVVAGVAQAQRTQSQPLTIFVRRSEVANARAMAPEARFVPVPHAIAEACLAAELEATEYDLLFCPLLVVEPATAKIPSAVMVPDLLHEYHPEFFTDDILDWRRQHYRPTVEGADAVFTLSEDAKRTIVEMFGVDPERITVVPLDVDAEFRAPSRDCDRAAFDRLRLPESYVYFPANYWPHKNHDVLLQAMRLLAERHPSLHLVLTGARATGEDRVRGVVASLGLADRVRIAGYQDRAVLPEIYRHARMLVFPSRFEGFGLPILEAFHCGTPVVTSNVGSCPEIAGDAALLVDPTDAAAIAATVERLLDDAELCRDLVAKGRDRIGAFSWGEAVGRTLRAFERITPRRAARALMVEDRPVVSIVTPTFQMARFLEETIESVLAQDYPHIDYIVMDGGSTDGTRELLLKYDGRLRYRSGPDGGQADAINKGFRESRGRVFSFLNADDTYLPGAVGKAVTQLVAHPSAGLVYGEGQHVFENGALMGRYPTQPYSAEVLAHNCYICQPTVFLWSDIFESAGMMDTRVIALDYDLWIRISRQGHDFLKIDDELATSRMYRDNKTLRARGAVYRDIIAIVKRHYGYVPYSWLFGYACFLVDRKDQVFEATSPSRLKILVSLALGARYNPRHLRRWTHEWAGQVGLLPPRRRAGTE
jgi:glycosyltransferase involved in cell wall biosynthesis